MGQVVSATHLHNPSVFKVIVHMDQLNPQLIMWGDW